MPLSPQERLKRLEAVLKEKEKKKRKLSEEEKQTAEEVESAKRQVAEGLEELRRDEEVAQLQERIALLESQGRGDDTIVAELSRRGIDPGTLQRAMRLHAHDHPGHEHEMQLERSLEELAEDAPEEKRDGGVSYDPRRNRGPLYDLASRAQGAKNFYELASRDMYDSLTELERQVKNKGFLGEDEYNTLNAFQEQLEQHQHGYQDSAAYARRENAVIERIKELAGQQGRTFYERHMGGDQW